MPYRYYHFFFGIQLVIMLASLCLVHKEISFIGLTSSFSSFIFPLTFIITDMVAEIYSYQESRRLLWSALLAQIPFSILCMLSNYLPSPHSQGIESFQFVFSNLLQVSGASILAAYIGLNLNLLVFTKLRKSSKYLNLYTRFFIATLVGEFVFTIIALPIMFINTPAQNYLLSHIKISLLIKLIYSLFLSFPSSLLVNIVKEHEVKRCINDKFKYFTYDPFATGKKLK